MRATKPTAWRHLSRGELALLALAAAWSLIPLLAVAAYIARQGGVFVGGEGLDPQDVLQYLAWVRDSGEHLAAATKFSLEPSDPVLVEPVFLVSGLLHRAGLGLELSYLLWKPVAVATLFGGFAAYVHRFVSTGAEARLAVLAVAIFFYPPALALVDHVDIVSPGALFQMEQLRAETFAAGGLWGAYPLAIALGLMPIFLIVLERGAGAADRPRDGRYLAAAAVIGAIVSWLHPWQGATLLAILGGLAVWDRLRWRTIVSFLGPGLVTLVPLLYYVALSRLDPTWEAVTARVDAPLLTWWILPVVLAPLAIPALGGLRGRAVGLQERALRLWPLAIAALYFLAPSYRFHALVGVALPLTVLAARGWGRLSLGRRWTAAVVASLVLIGLVQPILEFRDLAQRNSTALYIAADEERALRYLEQASREGGVLAPFFLGEAIPATTGRHTWVGHPGWVPDFVQRAGRAEVLFNGDLGRRALRRLVSRSGATYLLSDCKDRADLSRPLGPLLLATHRFGCATVYELVDRGQPALAAGRERGAADRA